jgi:heme-degrading monooxygenase HmoA
MYARLFTVQVSPDRLDEFIQVWHHAMLPTAQAQKGWNSARLLVDRETGKVIVVGFWETEADALASGAGSAYAEKQRELLGSLATAPPVMEHYEVAGEA